MAESAFARQQRETTNWQQSLRALTLGLPAFGVAVVVIACLTQASREQQGGELSSHYLDAAQKAVDAEDWTLAEMLSRKVANLRAGDPAGRYLLALSAEGTGDLMQARRLMQQLAPADRPGFAPAQWWIVRDLTTRANPLSLEQAQTMRDHLSQFLATHEHHAEARMLLGQAELALGDIDAALREMGRAADYEPAYRLTVARVAARIGRHTASRSHAERACLETVQQLSELPGDVALRLRYVDGLILTGEFQLAGDTLLKGLERDNDPRLRAGLVQLSITAYDVLDRQDSQEDEVFNHQLALIERALRMAPDHRPLLKRLAVLSVDPRDDQGQAHELLQARLETGNVPAVVHMVLGNAALVREDYGSARSHLEEASRQQPGYAVCLNNLAWALAHGEALELERALQLVERAIEIDPDRVEFHETRGQVLVRLGRFDEAVSDLQRGLTSPVPTAHTHAVLAEAYDAMGETELAAYYRELE